MTKLVTNRALPMICKKMPRLFVATYIRVAVVRRIRRGSITEFTKVVELLARVVSVNVDAVPRKLVDRVLDRPDAARGRVLCDADVVPQTPSEDPPIVVVIVGPAGRHVKGLDHRAALLDVLGSHVQVVIAAARHDERVGLLLGKGQCAADVVCIVHAGNDACRGPGDRACGWVVLPGEDGFGRGGIEDGVVGVQRDAVRKLIMISIS